MCEGGDVAAETLEVRATVVDLEDLCVCVSVGLFVEEVVEKVCRGA